MGTTLATIRSWCRASRGRQGHGEAEQNQQRAGTFIARIAVVSRFVLAWWTMAGADRVAAVSRGVMLRFLLATYGRYLAPVGLPNSSLRLIAENPPPLVEWAR